MGGVGKGGDTCVTSTLGVWPRSSLYLVLIYATPHPATTTTIDARTPAHTPTHALTHFLGLTAERKGSHGFTLELFRLRDKTVGVEVLEVKERVLDLIWEPGAASTRFALIMEPPSMASRYIISFYSMQPVGPPHLLFTVDPAEPAWKDRGAGYNAVHWSPTGSGHAVLLNSLSPTTAGKMEFIEVGAKEPGKRSLAITEHANCTDVAWDPSGRTLASWKTQPLPCMREPATRETVQNGFTLWSFQGAKIFETERTKVFQFLWRPRPAK